MIGRMKRAVARSLWRSSKNLDDDSRYTIEFITAELDADIYLVPRYASHRPASISILQGEFYEPLTHELVGKLLQEAGGDMVHAGTFFGDMLPSFARKCAGTVYAFEPVLENYVLAKLCLERNCIGNVVLLNAAVGTRTSVVHMDTGADTPHRGGSSFVADAGQVTSMIAIDAFELENLSVLQLDIEGSELNALKGASKTLKRCSPTVLIEDYNEECDAFLKNSGYAFVGEIPGLRVWAAKARFDFASAALPSR